MHHKSVVAAVFCARALFDVSYRYQFQHELSLYIDAFTSFEMIGMKNRRGNECAPQLCIYRIFTRFIICTGIAVDWYGNLFYGSFQSRSDFIFFLFCCNSTTASKSLLRIQPERFFYESRSISICIHICFFFCVKPEPKVIWSFYWSVYFKNWVDVQLQRSYRSLYFTLRTLSARIQLNVRTKYLRYSWTYWIIFVKNQTHFYDCVDLNIFFQIKFRERKKVTN